jgi:hypothetical protein
MAKTKGTTGAVDGSEEKEGLQEFHFLARSIKKMPITSDPDALTGAEFDAVVNKWLQDGWRLSTIQIADTNESMWTIGVALVR